ncbi:MAG: AI-2E family transporter [Hyphomicrobiales bacterium]|nr:AI-2E family transporter [Hyphomicrobiales bacterium]MCP5002294.1 AI-2E family transporter [Hyphomicrobiales bacterium]
MATQINRASLRRQAFFWLATLIVFGLFLYLFRGILLPFVAGMALAYFLDPVADKLESWGVSRLMATILILVAFLLIFIVALMIVVPVLASQASGFVGKLPEYVDRLQTLFASTNTEWLTNWVGIELPDLKSSLGNLLSEGAGLVGTVFLQIWNSGKALADLASLFVVTPVVAFYLLLDWDRMVEAVDNWIPRRHAETVREISQDMNRAIAGFVRGQGSVCLILGIYYAAGLTLSGLNFGLLIGMFAGLISFIPYVGSMVGLILALGVALVQFWPDYVSIIIVLVVFFTGQFFEGNILQPKLVGRSVGLHPVWLMFALFAFGSLFGFVGLLIAVPASAALAVLVRYALKRYLESDLYDDGSTPVEANAEKDNGK